MFRHDCPLAVKSARMPRRLVHKITKRDSLLNDMLLSAVSILVVAQPSSEVPEALMNYPEHSWTKNTVLWIVGTIIQFLAKIRQSTKSIEIRTQTRRITF
jgi:hypothetical protein